MNRNVSSTMTSALSRRLGSPLYLDAVTLQQTLTHPAGRPVNSGAMHSESSWPTTHQRVESYLLHRVDLASVRYEVLATAAERGGSP